MFRELSTLPGELTDRQSMGSATQEFLYANFACRDLHDIVYVTGNPQVEHHWDGLDTSFHAIEHVWRNQWDDEQQTVLPCSMTAAARYAREQYPNKRLIIHYLQPHYPFVGSDLDEAKGKFENPDTEIGIWKKIAMGQVDISQKEIWNVYRENLALALESVAELVRSVSERVVVTSDHGNFVGERSGPVPVREWGHPFGTYQPELTTVPWQVVKSENRPEITNGPPTNHRPTDDEVVTSRLQALGYNE